MRSCRKSLCFLLGEPANVRPMRRRRSVLVLAAALCGFVALGADVATGASPVSGFVSGMITSVKGSTFTVSTTVSPTGKSKVSVGSKTTIVEQEPGTRSDVKKGVCAMATGTKKGSVVTATRLSIRGRCAVPNGRPGGAGRRPGSGSLTPPANLGFAFGTVSKVDGSTVTVKARQGSTTVALTGKTQITRTVVVHMSAVKVKLCAFVRGTSSDGGVTVQAQQVQLSQPFGGGCGFRRR